MSTIHLADIFASDYKAYCERFGHCGAHDKVARALMACRTEALGGHRYECPDCTASLTVHNSCGNRHCPRCQSLARRSWVEARTQELLPVPYFHVVFTIPSELNPFALRNKRAFYSILFRSVNETLQELAATSRYLGASIGFIAVLHTWGQNLIDHPHIHCIVPAGGLSRDGKQWVRCKEQFLFPFAVMRKLFAGKVLAYFKKALTDGAIELTGSLSDYANSATMQLLLNKLYNIKWVIFAKQPFASPTRVIAYLGNYTHRVAISESRLLQYENSAVTISYKDYADGCKVKQMRLEGTEFIRRFLMHVLPSGFMRIRHYGFLSNSNRTRKLKEVAAIFTLLQKRLDAATKLKQTERVPWHERMYKQTGVHPLLCRTCKKAVMVLVAHIEPLRMQMQLACDNGVGVVT